MDIAKRVAKIRFMYHANMTSIVNVLYQLGIYSGDKAEVANKEHVFKAIDCLTILGYDTKEFYENEES